MSAKYYLTNIFIICQDLLGIPKLQVETVKMALKLYEPRK